MFGQPMAIAPLDTSLTPFISIVREGTPEYAALLSELPPELLTGLTPILPFSIIIRNASTHPLLMTSILFETEDYAGKVLHFSMTSMDLNSVSASAMQPNDIRFVSISAPANHAVTARRVDSIRDLRTPLSSLAADLYAKRRVSSPKMAASTVPTPAGFSTAFLKSSAQSTS
jgi:hypothetical protein